MINQQYQANPPNLIEVISYEDILAEMKDKLIELYPAFNAMTESDPVYKLLEVSAYFRVLDRQRVNDAALSVLLDYATKNDLDEIGKRYDVKRKVITPEDDKTVPPTPAVMESDDDYRIRIPLAFEGMSVAGPVNAYRYHALQADNSIADVSAISPSPGEVLISLLSYNDNGHVNDDVIDIVYQALNRDDVRPLTDKVTVQSSEIIEYKISATLYIAEGPNNELILSDAKQRAMSYVSEQARIGRNIRLSILNGILSVDGVQNVIIHIPENDIVLDKTQASFCTDIKLDYGGEDE